MNHLDYFSTAKHPVETCIVGSGGFGRSFVSQGQKMPLMHARVAVDVKAATAARCLTDVGIAPDKVALCYAPEEAKAAWDAGKFIAAEDLGVVLALPLDVVVEATGNPEAGARHARMAIEAGRHVVMVSKEVDSVVGPGLSLLARQNGKVVTPVDGDQPSLLIGLVTWAKTLGFEILAAGKSSEYDFVFDAETGTLTSNGKEYALPTLASLMLLGEDVVATVAERSRICAELPQRIVADLCELLVVANSTGMTPDRPDLHAPIARAAELADVFAPREEGGILDGTGVLDVFHCLRRPDEASFAGGVFIIIRCEDSETWELLREKGHVVSRDGKRGVVHIPRHLLGLEAATSVLEAAVHGRSTGSQSPFPHFDLVARAARDFRAGSTLSMGGHHHTIEGVTAELHPAKPVAADNPAPFYLISNCPLRRDVAAGSLITRDDVDIASGSELFALRRMQDEHFLGNPGCKHEK